jgi:hypothetical protein
MWYRVFGRGSEEPTPASLAAHLHAAGLAVEPHFKGDDLGWTSGELGLPGLNTPVRADRYPAPHDEIRDDLNSYAAILETCDYSPNSGPLMERVIQTQQLIVLRKPLDAMNEVTLEELLIATCRFLATATDGIYQIDGQGWFNAAGEMLLQEY